MPRMRRPPVGGTAVLSVRSRRDLVERPGRANNAARRAYGTAMRGVRLLLVGTPLLLLAAAPPPGADVLRPQARGQTEPMQHAGDSADDPAIWLHPTKPELSLILGTDKQGGLVVYDMDGKRMAT